MWRFVVLSAAVALLLVIPGSRAAAAYPACSPGMIALETQVWWKGTGGAMDPAEPGHVHLGACFPLYGKLSAPYTESVLVQLHNNSSLLRSVRWMDGSSIKQKVRQNFSCPVEQCERRVPLTIDPALFDYSGYREVRLVAKTRTSDGSWMFNTTRWCVLVDNDKPRRDYCNRPRGRLGAAGWYTGMSYANVYIDKATFPFRSVHGIWHVTAKFQRDHGFASIDPRFHGGYPGQVVYDGDGANVWRDIAIDTRSLTNGPHRLFLRTDASIMAPFGVGSGVFTLPFTVAN